MNECKGSLTQTQTQTRKLLLGSFRGKQMYIEQDFSKC